MAKKKPSDKPGNAPEVDYKAEYERLKDMIESVRFFIHTFFEKLRKFGKNIRFSTDVYDTREMQGDVLQGLNMMESILVGEDLEYSLFAQLKQYEQLGTPQEARDLANALRELQKKGLDADRIRLHYKIFESIGSDKDGATAQQLIGIIESYGGLDAIQQHKDFFEGMQKNPGKFGYVSIKLAKEKFKNALNEVTEQNVAREASLTGQLQDKRKVIDDLRIEVKKLETELEKYVPLVEKSQKDAQKAQATVETLSGELESAKTNIKELEDQRNRNVIDLEKRLGEVSYQLEESKQENERLTTQLGQLETTYQERLKALNAEYAIKLETAVKEANAAAETKYEEVMATKEKELETKYAAALANQGELHAEELDKTRKIAVVTAKQEAEAVADKRIQELTTSYQKEKTELTEKYEQELFELKDYVTRVLTAAKKAAAKKTDEE